jgi:hypothetical protein
MAPFFSGFNRNRVSWQWLSRTGGCFCHFTPDIPQENVLRQFGAEAVGKAAKIPRAYTKCPAVVCFQLPSRTHRDGDGVDKQDFFGLDLGPYDFASRFRQELRPISARLRYPYTPGGMDKAKSAE